MAISGSESLVERLTERSKQVMLYAQHEAAITGSPEIDDPHVLIGLLVEEEGLAARVLELLGITVRSVRAQLGTTRDHDRTVSTDADRADHWTQSCSASVEMILELALRETKALNHNYIGTEHILLAIASEYEGRSRAILRALGATPEVIRGEVIRMLSGPGGARMRTTSVGRETVDDESPKQNDTPAPEALEAVPTHPDRPATRDELGRARLASVLAERMRRVRGEDTEAPAGSWRERRSKRRRDAVEARRAGSFMVHLHAPWGAGKSSLLNFLADDLRNRDQRARPSRLGRIADFLFGRRRPTDPQLSRWIAVEFSAWEHQRLATPWWWLLAAIQRSCARELWRIKRRRWAWFWVRDVAWRLWNARAAVFTLVLLAAALILAWATDWFGLRVESLTAAQTAVLTVGSVIALATTLWGLIRGAGRWLAIGSSEGAVRFLRRAHDPLGVYRRRFRWLVRSAGQPITVFIDDLDRCKPAYVVELLEGIQTLFAAEPVSYVVAADRTWLCESFARGYGEFEGSIGDLGRPLGFLFLEKTFQISMEIPPMSPNDRERYWSRLMRGGDNGATAVAADATQKQASRAFDGATTQAEVEERVEDLLSSGADNEEVLVAAMRKLNNPDMQDQLEYLLTEFAPLLESNPRSMKRLVNAYGVERDRLLRDGYLLTREERKQLALLVILRLRWPELAEHLRRFPDDVSYCTDVSVQPHAEHPYRSLLVSNEVRRLFDGSEVGETLGPELMGSFPDRPPG